MTQKETESYRDFERVVIIFIFDFSTYSLYEYTLGIDCVHT